MYVLHLLVALIVNAEILMASRFALVSLDLLAQPPHVDHSVL